MVVAELPGRTTRLEPTTVGRALRRVREGHGLTQGDVARTLGMSTSGYAHYENGRARLTLQELPKFAAALRTTDDELAEALGVIPAIADDERPTVETIVRSIYHSNDFSDDDKEFLARLVERSRRVVRGEPDPYPDDERR